MPGFSAEARRIITGRCLIAADVDKTILLQGEDKERQVFLAEVAPQLVRAASLGAHLAFLTGNSMHELTSRFLSWLIAQLCFTDDLNLLSRFHFFCNSGGVYAHIMADDRIQSLFGHASTARAREERVFRAITITTERGEKAIRPEFVDGAYIERSKIPPEDATEIASVLEDAIKPYIESLKENWAAYAEIYNLESFFDTNGIKVPRADLRQVASGRTLKETTVQITLKPVLSFRYARNQEELFQNDARTSLILDIQKALDQRGLGYYVARPGGRSSIDVTLEKLDKAYAVEFLIDRLNLQGQTRKGQKLGYNSIYFGDEVIAGGGNDYPVTRIPGLLVMAVNPDKKLIPYLSHVFVPSAILEGVDATAKVVSEFNSHATQLLMKFDRGEMKKKGVTWKTALEALKEEIFSRRVLEKVDNLRKFGHASVDDWQVLHAFVTLMGREDPAAREWLAILINELDAIMTQIGNSNPSLNALAIGASHPDS